MRQWRFWSRRRDRPALALVGDLTGVSEPMVARFSTRTVVTSVVLIVVACIALLIIMKPQFLWGGPPGPGAAPPPPTPSQKAPPPPTVDPTAVPIRYPQGMDQQIVTAATTRTRQAGSILREQLGWTLGPAAVVELLEQRPITVDDGESVRLAATDASVPLLVHGLARSAVVARTRGNAPGWLREGLADYALERAGYAGRQARIDLLRPIGPLPFDQLAKVPAGTVADPQYERAVATGQLLADYLEQHKGADAVTALLNGLAQKDALSAVAEASGLALPALEQDFRTWLGDGQRAGDRPVTPPDPTPWMAGYSRPAPPVRTQYQLDVKLDPATFHLTGKQQVRITNNEAIPLESLYFHLFPNAPYFATGKRAGALTVQSVRADGQPVPFTGGKDEILGLRLPAPLAPGAAVTLDLNWEATVPDVADRYGVDGPTIVLGNFYPILAMHDAGGWHLDRYVPAGDPFYSDVADYDVTFTAPDGYRVAATGHPDAAGRRFTAANVRDFAAAASKDWQLYEQTVDGVHLRYYWSKLDENTVTPEA
ncbi:MAG: Peptidase rane alanine aminopeptidase, partial [Firmicutes bacterium]|nr:Peptidase rane alanine aminopeptidase [Bacillota bacterium]